MAPEWALRSRPLGLVLLAVTLGVTFAFDADVERQGGAYATGVLVLMVSASVAVALALWREARRTSSVYFWLVTALLGYTLIDNVLSRPDGLIIGGIFSLAIVLSSALSRFLRSTELRVEELRFTDEESRLLCAPSTPIAGSRRRRRCGGTTARWAPSPSATSSSPTTAASSARSCAPPCAPTARSCSSSSTAPWRWPTASPGRPKSSARSGSTSSSPRAIPCARRSPTCCGARGRPGCSSIRSSSATGDRRRRTTDLSFALKKRRARQRRPAGTRKRA